MKSGTTGLARCGRAFFFCLGSFLVVGGAMAQQPQLLLNLDKA